MEANARGGAGLGKKMEEHSMELVDIWLPFALKIVCRRFAPVHVAVKCADPSRYAYNCVVPRDMLGDGKHDIEQQAGAPHGSIVYLGRFSSL